MEKVIVIIASKTDSELTDVVQWIDFFKTKYLILEMDEFCKLLNHELSIKFEKPVIDLENKLLQVISVWNRSQNNIRSFINIKFENLSNINSIELAIQLYEDRKRIYEYVSWLLNKFKIKQINNFFSINYLNKIVVLEKATEIGLKIPEFKIVKDKITIIDHLRNKRYITKGVNEGIRIKEKKKIYMHYTTLISNENISKLPTNFYPSLLQDYIQRKYDLRLVFAIDTFYGVLYESSISEDVSDMRQENFKNNKLKSAFKLLPSYETKLKKLLLSLNLNFACIDLILGQDNELYFLEVNPSGIFGEIDKIGNYYICKSIAEFLVNERN